MEANPGAQLPAGPQLLQSRPSPLKKLRLAAEADETRCSRLQSFEEVETRYSAFVTKILHLPGQYRRRRSQLIIFAIFTAAAWLMKRKSGCSRPTKFQSEALQPPSTTWTISNL